MKVWITNLFAGLIFCACLAPDLAIGRDKIDLVLLRDVSGSMRKTDPGNRSTEAVRLLMDLLDKQDRMALLTFDREARVLSDFIRLQDPEKSRLRSLILNQGRPSGAYTNLHAALVEGLKKLKAIPREDARPLAVLFTDGQMDVGTKSEDQRLVSEVKNKIIPLYRSLGITLYTVAFSDGADFDFLREIAQQTGGFAIRVYAPEDLPKIFAKVFEIAKEPEMVPIEGGLIEVDDSISELTMLIDGPPEAGRLALVSPSGKSFLSGDDTHRITWLKQPSYSMISIEEPEPGSWLIKGESGDARAYILTNISLEAQLVEAWEQDGGKRIEAWLEKDKNRLNDRRILEVADFTAEISSIEESGELVQTLRLHDDGADGDKSPGDAIYFGLLAPLGPGQFQIKVTIDAKAFKRSKNLFLESAAPSTETVPPVIREGAPTGETNRKTEEPPAKSPEAAQPGAPGNDEGPGIAHIQGNFFNALKILVIANVLALGLGALSFGGYKLYKRNAANKNRGVSH